MWEKNKGTIKCDKSTITCDVSTTQYEDNTIKCEKKINELPNVAKYNHMWYWYCIMWGWYNQMWKKIKESPNVTNTVTCDVGTVQYEDDTIKYEKKKGNH